MCVPAGVHRPLALSLREGHGRLLERRRVYRAFDGRGAERRVAGVLPPGLLIEVVEPASCAPTLRSSHANLRPIRVQLPRGGLLVDLRLGFGRHASGFVRGRLLHRLGPRGERGRLERLIERFPDVCHRRGGCDRARARDGHPRRERRVGYRRAGGFRVSAFALFLLRGDVVALDADVVPVDER